MMLRVMCVALCLFVNTVYGQPAETWDWREIQAVTDLSPAYVKAKNKAGWLGLYAKGAEIVDPEGARKQTDLEAFWDTFIAPNDIEFETITNVYSGKFRVRKVLIHTSSLEGKVKLTVPAHIVYEMVKEDGQMRIKSMHAHWNEGENIANVFGKGVYGFQLSMQMGTRILKNLGIGSMMDFTLNGFSIHQGTWMSIVNNFVESLSRNVTAKSLAYYFAPESVSIATLESLRGIHPLNGLTSTIIAGNYASVFVTMADGKTGFLRFRFDGSSKIRDLWVAVDSVG